MQIGAGIASVIGRRFGLSAQQCKALVPVGCSAALAAAFNTPIAAVLFSLEEILGDMHAPVLGSVVLSSATSWMVLHLILGDQPLFHVPAYQLVHPMEFGIYAVLGSGGRTGFGVFRQAAALSCASGFESSRRRPLAATGRRGPCWWAYGLVHAGGAGRRIRLRGARAGRRLSAQDRSAAGGVEDRRDADVLLVRKRGRHLRPSLFIGAMIGGAVGGDRAYALPRTPRIRGRTLWWAWARRSRGSCGRR